MYNTELKPPKDEKNWFSELNFINYLVNLSISLKKSVNL